MSLPVATDARPARKARRPISRGAILLVGVIIVPIALSVAFNSYGALTEESALRMAAATVAGQTVAVLSAVVALVLTVARGYAPPAILAFTLIAVVIVAGAVGAVTTAGDLLLQRLDLVATVNQHNG